MKPSASLLCRLSPLWALAFACVAASAAAQTYAPPPPALEAVPDVPLSAPPDPDLEPQVTLIQKDQELVEEVRIAGQLKFVRVTPLHGKTYYLVPDAGGYTFIRRDSLDTGLKVPLWVLYSW